MKALTRQNISQASTATYNTPRGLNTAREDEKEPWPVCKPQVYSELTFDDHVCQMIITYNLCSSVIINAAELMLIKYDFKISNRYKLIRYEDDDATAKLKIGQNHFVEITLPGVAAMLSFILFILLCSR